MPKKYLLGSPEVVLWTVTNDMAFSQQKARVNKSAQYGTITPDPSTNLVRVAKLDYATTNAMRWMIVPNRRGGRDATLKDLPPAFGSFVSRNQNEPIPFEWNGQHLQVELPASFSNPKRTYRTWWGHPVQVLILPAVAMDIVIWPYELYLGLNEFGKAF